MHPTNTNLKLEIIAFTLEGCTIIEQSGANRIELCDNPSEGGTTPSYGMIKSAREKVSIPLVSMIRPRGGDFLYSEDEFDVMKEDISNCKQAGCNGVVFGLLKKDGNIDVSRTAKLVELAYPMEVTFHRAFDHCKEPFKALNELIEIGCKRILTSGQQLAAIEGAELIKQLVGAAEDRIIIMPGGGINAGNIKELSQKTGAIEFHASLRTWAQSKMGYVNPAFAHEEGSDEYVTTEEQSIRAVLNVLNSLS